MLSDTWKAVLFHLGEFQADCPFIMLKSDGKSFLNSLLRCKRPFSHILFNALILNVYFYQFFETFMHIHAWGANSIQPRLLLQLLPDVLPTPATSISCTFFFILITWESNLCSPYTSGYEAIHCSIVNLSGATVLCLQVHLKARRWQQIPWS